MIVTTRFSVAAPLPQVWRHMLDVQKVAPCVPGATLTEVIDDRTFAGKIEVKLGPIGVGYHGTLHIEEIDEPAFRIKLRAEGAESRGRGGAKATVQADLSAENEKTLVVMTSDIAVSGLVAQFGRSAIMQEVSQKMAQRFADCLEKDLRAQTPVG